MKKMIKHSLILIGMMAGYVILINLVAFISQLGGFSYEDGIEQGDSGGDVKVGVGESVSVTVQRNRWYGKIIENVGDDSKISYVYLLGFLRLPLIINKFNFVYVHILMFVAIASVSVFLWRRKSKGFYVPF
ncbi:hypothetical protein HYV49_03080 [Candidatus Pacearchaeota archaeon]|nr:hypothetical protein [Candidatus Pacearchaeota archaeon]